MTRHFDRIAHAWLPSCPTFLAMIPIKLKRRLGYKHHYQFKNVRPKKVLDTAKYLVDTSELFRTEGIKVQNAWVDGITSQSSTYEEWSEFVQTTNKSSADV